MDEIIKIKNFIEQTVSNSKGIVIGLSGGLDSTVTAYLCKQAIPDKQIIGVLMPDAVATSEGQDMKDAELVAEKLDITKITIPIQKIYEEYLKSTTKFLEQCYYDKKVLGNIKARIRGNILYTIANSMNLLVVGTSDRSEWMLGYFTKHGDGACDFMPIVHLYKTQVRDLGKKLEIPNSILTKPSSPQLWDSQTAEEELGITYEQADKILSKIPDNLDYTKLTKESITKESFALISNLIKQNSHKRTKAKSLLNGNNI